MTEATVVPATRVRSPRVLLAGLVAALVAALLVTAPHQASAAGAEGLACETPSSPGVFNLATSTGYIFMPDGNSVFMWGYAGSKGFQIPGPTLCVDQGTQVTVNLSNTLPEPVSIIFPGQTGVQADGQPVQPVADTAGRITSLVQPAAAKVGTGPAGTVSYTFTADRPGTYLYTSGTDQTKQIQMGLYGALVVRPAGMPNRAYAAANTGFTPGHEYLHVLSEIDPALHLAVERRRAYDIKTYLPRYFLINGRAMPDTLAPNDAAWLPGQPYGATVHVQPGQVALIRYLNVGMKTYPFHPHGNDQRVIARDGNPLITGSTDLSYEKFLVDVGPGQTVDTLFRWDDVEHWSPTNPVPVELPPLPDQLITGDTWFSESPYLGYQGELPVNVTSNNECGEYYHIAHSHALEQSTNFGTAFGGMMTLIRIDPPAGCVGTAP